MQMKIRNGFVSNSSSASFIVCKDCCTEEQIYKILHFDKLSQIQIDQYDAEFGFDYDNEGSRYRNLPSEDYKYWKIVEYNKTIKGHTSMDNFGMDDFFKWIGLPEEAYEYNRDG
jgi:hypothetical protein